MKFIFGADTVPTKFNISYFENGEIDKIIDKGIKDIIDNTDYHIFNLETPLSDGSMPINKRGPNLIASKKCVNGIKKLNPSLILLSNNHTLDYGEEALKDTTNVLDSNNIKWIGAGANLEEAKRPFIFEKDGIKVGIYNCCEHEFTIAGEDSWGANPFDPLESLDHITELKEKCDYVIVVYHGGKEHYRYPSPDLQKRCRKMIEKGADAVLCQHSHCVGCYEDYKNGKIIYGQGNYIFAGENKLDSWYTSLLIEIIVDNGLEFNYIPLCSNSCSVELAKGDKAKEIIDGYLKRSEQIKDKKFVEDNFLKIANKDINWYLKVLSSTEKDKSEETNCLVEKYPMSTLAGIYNYFNCEAHREVVMTAIKNKLDN